MPLRRLARTIFGAAKRKAELENHFREHLEKTGELPSDVPVSGYETYWSDSDWKLRQGEPRGGKKELRQALVGELQHMGPITYRDPKTGETKTIENVYKEFLRQKRRQS